jgi:hypothetical protein
MSKVDIIHKLGDPDLKMNQFKLWIHGRQFPELDDFWDGNWLNVSAYCNESGASVYTNGAIVHLSEIEKWLNLCQDLNQKLSGVAELKFLEPNLVFQIELKKGSGTLEICITPDHMNQDHKFTFDIDQSYLSSIILDCKEILKEYPIKNK